MQRLSGTDALFLTMETPEWHQHIAGLTVLDPSTSEDFSFEKAVAHLESRLPLAPKFKWKLKETPLNLDRAVWIEDTNFDLARHIRRAGVPQPGGKVETAELLSQIMTRQLDRRYPLWEFWYLDGLANGRLATVVKFHHCLLDGMAGASLATVLTDLEPDPPPREIPKAKTSAGREPSSAELLARSVLPNMRTPMRIARYTAEAGRRGLALLEFNRTAEDTAPLTGVPTTRWNAEISARRTNAFTSISLEDVKKIRRKYDVKVNDVVLAICSGALREYLLSHDELPEEPLVAGVPVSTRSADDNELNNQIANMNVSLATDEPDPKARLKAIAKSSKASKAMTNAIRAHQIQSIGETAPPLMLNFAIRALARTGALRAMPTVMNTVVSNVPGPPFPLYFAGALTTGMFPGSVITETMGLNITVLSYIDRIDFGLSADPELVPDLWDIADGIPKSLKALMKAGKLGKPTKVEDPFGEPM
ncbi:MAG: wax ester/triacylglycerol synthase family O-acyltransferase [Acidimicrobiales bacterium]|nr:wax ester/triacylglycerol synthase family O-acyltransferase [Acidimicrobiales bacterium]